LAELREPVAVQGRSSRVECVVPDVGKSDLVDSFIDGLYLVIDMLVNFRKGIVDEAYRIA
jgi:hypothetical protein